MKPLIRKVNTHEFTRIFSFTFFEHQSQRRWKLVAIALADFIKIEKRTEREVKINNLLLFAHSEFGCFWLAPLGIFMAIPVVEFSEERYKLRKVFG